MAPRSYDQFRPTFSDRRLWNTPAVLRHRAQTHGERVYLDVPSTGERYSYGETLELAERVARGLLAAGAVPGDRLLIMLPNCSAYILAWLGSSLACMAEVPINTAYRGSFLEHQAATVEPKLALIHPDYAARFAESAEAARTVARFYLVGGDSAARAAAAATLRDAEFAVSDWDDLLAAGADGAAVDLPAVRHCDLGAVFFTSGTTGPSKGVMMPHAHMHLFADQCVSLTRLTDADVYMSTGPLFHGNSHFLAAQPALIAGARYVLQERFSASAWAAQIRDSGATVTNFVGVMMDFVWQQPPQPGDAENALRCIFAAPTASGILGAFKARFGVEAFVEVFGLTETCMPILSPYGEPRPPGAAGLANSDWFDVRLVDSETDEEVPVGELGELVVRARCPWTQSVGYYNMPEATQEAWRNLWWHTGDGMRRDAEGWYYFVDRLKDAIRRRGENISSYEVEQALLAHPGVAEAAAVAVPADQEAGEDEVLVVIVAEPDAALTAEEIWRYGDRRLPYFAVPRYLRFVAELPKTPSEKVRKVELRAAGVTADSHDRGPAPRRGSRRA
ncbi:MAG: ATP-dependent acyl-CoA ligase [Acidimicrobiia bacterium]|nr:ATP-dependent acyl-CoA ligase [Acidimicrobiia bacterium]MYB25093.1 ATP-dependent acyl-CoA ligase [Acidimicrobiia bacterium]MYJ13896.1 ATP-dependent acyl-CoA ligase [Acidimicrobiia bacterium]